MVTVADNGGSSGRLRDEFDVLPPGDLRMALSALCDDSEWGHRGATSCSTASPVPARSAATRWGTCSSSRSGTCSATRWPGLDLVGRLLNSRGRVLPMAAESRSQIEAEVQGADPALPDEVSTVRGQVAVASTTGRVRSIALRPGRPAGPRSHGAGDGARRLDHPGARLLVHLGHAPPLVPDLRAALHDTQPGELLTLNVEHSGETAGFSAAKHLEVLAEHAPRLRLDVVLADPGAIDDDDALRRAAARLGAEVVAAPVAKRGHPGHHDSLRLAAAYRDILG